MSKTAEVHLHGELRDFLPAGASGTVRRTFDVSGSVKDLIESCGVPHTEVAVILAKGRPVDFAHRVEDGDIVDAYPLRHELPFEPEVVVGPGPLVEHRFVLDVHLGALARFLRLLGFDCEWQRGRGDRELVEISSRQHRLLLTRDVGLLMHRDLARGYYVRETDPETQLVEVVRRFDLKPHLRPFTRCMVCNTELRAVDKASVAERLPLETRRHFHEFQQCDGCDRIYWKGSHHARLQVLVNRIRTA